MAHCESRRPARGFSYLWVLLAVALMGVGMARVGEVYHTARRQAQEQELILIGREFRAALRRYLEATPAGVPPEHPASLEDLLLDPRSPAPRRHLRRLYRDPVTGKAEWGLLRVGGKIVGVHSHSGEAPLKRAGFEPSEEMFAGAERYADWVFSYPPDLMVQPEGTGNVQTGANNVD